MTLSGSTNGKFLLGHHEATFSSVRLMVPKDSCTDGRLPSVTTAMPGIPARRFPQVCLFGVPQISGQDDLWLVWEPHA